MKTNSDRIRQDFFEEVQAKMIKRLRDEFGVSIEIALKSNPQYLMYVLVETMMFLLDEPKGQNLLFNGLSTTSSIYRTTAREDYFYRYMGSTIIQPGDFIHPKELETIEKDAIQCEKSGCNSNMRTLWCVKCYRVGDSSRNMCNFCAYHEGLAKIDKCTSGCEECMSCPNSKLADAIYGGNIQSIPKSAAIVPLKVVNGGV